jgi:hypothetical protein
MAFAPDYSRRSGLYDRNFLVSPLYYGCQISQTEGSFLITGLVGLALLTKSTGLHPRWLECSSDSEFCASFCRASTISSTPIYHCKPPIYYHDNSKRLTRFQQSCINGRCKHHPPLSGCCRLSFVFKADVQEYGSPMGWYSTWVPGCGHDTHPSCIQSLRAMVEKQEQALPIESSRDLKEKQTDSNTDFGARVDKAWVDSGGFVSALKIRPQLS